MTAEVELVTLVTFDVRGLEARSISSSLSLLKPKLLKLVQGNRLPLLTALLVRAGVEEVVGGWGKMFGL